MPALARQHTHRVGKEGLMKRAGRISSEFHRKDKKAGVSFVMLAFSHFCFCRYGKIVSTKAILDKNTNQCKGESQSIDWICGCDRWVSYVPYCTYFQKKKNNTLIGRRERVHYYHRHQLKLPAKQHFFRVMFLHSWGETKQCSCESEGSEVK